MNEVNVKIIPLGGCGEIGMNMTILQVDECSYFIDCGALFPDGSQIGVDLIFPSTEYIDQCQIQPTAWLITHGHEDHIGALPHLYKKYPAPIYGTAFTIELIKSKFSETSIEKAQFHVWKFFEPTFLKYLKIIPFPVNHSIADAAGLFIETPEKNLLHMGDFRIDYNPPERSMTHENLKRVLGGKTVDFMMSDSTNSFQSGTDKSETDIAPKLVDIFSSHQKAVILATFSSNIWRLKSVVEAAQKSGRKVVLFGRSMQRNVTIAESLNLISFDPDLIVEFDKIKNIERSKICVLCTGSQGEQFSGLHRLTWNNVSEFELIPGDLVMFSSRIIPGNEKSIDQITTQLMKMGLTVVTSKDDLIHVSGHGYQEDLKKCISVAQPKSFLPVHGTYKHLVKHRQLAIECGVPEQNCYLTENGGVVEIGPELKGVVENIPTGRDYLCPGGIFASNSFLYKERVALAWSGILVFSFIVNGHTSDLMCEPDFISKGLPENLKIDFKKIAKKSFQNVIEQAQIRKKINDDEFIKEELRISIRRALEQIVKYKCIISIILTKFG